TGITSAYAESGDLSAARALFERMPERNLAAWNAMIGAYSRNGLGQEALALFDSMRLHGERPDDITFVEVINACSHLGLVDRGCEAVRLMNHDYHGQMPTRDHFCCTVDLLARAGRVYDAEELLHTMPYLPDSVALNTLLSGCKMHGYVEAGRRVAMHA
ncbi:hypothetical protein SELMODRAFT_71962, partial [Selaginella moellendorffii]